MKCRDDVFELIEMSRDMKQFCYRSCTQGLLQRNASAKAFPGMQCHSMALAAHVHLMASVSSSLHFFEQSSHQLGFVAHHIHLCFQARMSDESLLAPHPRL